MQNVVLFLTRNKKPNIYTLSQIIHSFKGFKEKIHYQCTKIRMHVRNKVYEIWITKIYKLSQEIGKKKKK